MLHERYDFEGGRRRRYSLSYANGEIDRSDKKLIVGLHSISLQL
jgi:hypothetical protein